MSQLKYAKLRCCASCEWVFKIENNNPDCPKCQFGSYGAHYVYGKKAYAYAVSQKPHIDKKVTAYKIKLMREAADYHEDIMRKQRIHNRS